MRHIKTNRFILTFLLPMFLVLQLNAQTKFSAKNHINFSVSGTSTMHDWVMKSSDGICNATFNFDDKGNMTELVSMNLTVVAKALKSGKDGMDKNAYKSLKVDKNPNITAVLKSATVSTSDNKTYTIKSVIKLTIAGKTIETDLIAHAKKINDNSISVKGEKKISMKDYGVEPPSFMFGAVKTGNDIVLDFDVLLNQ